MIFEKDSREEKNNLDIPDEDILEEQGRVEWPYPNIRIGCRTVGRTCGMMDLWYELWPLLPPCVREETRHWRDLQTEEPKINKEEGTTLGVTGATD